MFTSRNKLVVLALLVLAALPVAARGSKEAGSLIEPNEAFEMVGNGEAVLVDVRDERSYLEAHLAGAIHVPLMEVGSSAERLQAQGKTIITYCSCPAEETSNAAAAELIARGVNDVLVLEGGIRAWANAGLPLRSGGRP